MSVAAAVTSVHSGGLPVQWWHRNVVGGAGGPGGGGADAAGSAISTESALGVLILFARENNAEHYLIAAARDSAEPVRPPAGTCKL